MSILLSHEKEEKRKRRGWRTNMLYFFAIIMGVGLIVWKVIDKLPIQFSLGGILLIALGFFAIYMDSKYDVKQFPREFHYNDELDMYTSLITKSYGECVVMCNKEVRCYKDWKEHIEDCLNKISDIEDFYWRLNIRLDRKKGGLDNWRTLSIPLLIAFIAFMLPISFEPESVKNEITWLLLGSVITILPLGILSISTANEYTQEICFLENLKEIVEERVKKEGPPTESKSIGVDSCKSTTRHYTVEIRSKE